MVSIMVETRNSSNNAILVLQLTYSLTQIMQYLKTFIVILLQLSHFSPFAFTHPAHPFLLCMTLIERVIHYLQFNQLLNLN